MEDLVRGILSVPPELKMMSSEEWQRVKGNELMMKRLDERKRSSGRTGDPKGNKKVKKKKKNVKEAPECQFYKLGKCLKGKFCTFRHEGVEVVAYKHVICKFHLTGDCAKGESCQYSHEFSKFPCRFFHLFNSCKEGKSCKFSHEPITDEEKKTLGKEFEGTFDHLIERKKEYEEKKKKKEEEERKEEENKFEEKNPFDKGNSIHD